LRAIGTAFGCLYIRRPKICLLFIAVLVEKKTNDTYRHIHTAAVSTWSHAGDVEKNTYPTPKQTSKNVGKPKQSPSLKQSCGNSKTVFST
jgi:hypothetical protein